MARVLVILPTGGYRTADFVAAADALGVELAVASERSDPLASPERFVQIDCARPDEAAGAIVELAVRTPVDAIIAADDQGVAAAARASALLGLPHHPSVPVETTRDKTLLRRTLDIAEVSQPAYRTVAPVDVADAAAQLGFPVVVKARTLTASQGVLRVDEPGRLAESVDRIQSIRSAAGEDPESHLVVERFVPGPEYTVEGIVWDGRLEVLAVMEKPDPLDGPAFQETIFVTPPRDDSVIEPLVATVRRSVHAIGLSNGPIHAEARLGPKGPVMLEVAARTIGGLCGRALRFGLMGTSLEALVIRNALGIERDLPTPSGASGVLMIPIPHAGRLVEVGGVEDVRALDGITGIEITAVPGSQIAPPPDGNRYLGFVFARGDDPDQVTRLLRTAQARLVVRIS